MVNVLLPMPSIAAPNDTRKRARSWTCGSDAALRRTVVPGARTAAINAFSVPVTLGSSRKISAALSLPSSLYASPTVTSAPRRSSARKCVSTRRRPMTSPPGGGSVTPPKRACVKRSRTFALVHPALALALVLVAGIGITRLSRPSFRPPSLLADLVATGVPFLLLGLLLGPGLGVIDAAGLRLLQPVVALGIGWSGALFGAQLEWRMMRRGSGHAWLIGATLALPVLLVTAATAWMLAHALPALAESWGRPSLAVALVLGGALTTAASQPGPRLGRRNALFDTAFGAAAVTIGITLYHPHVTVRTIILTLLVGGGLGSLFVTLARGAMLNEPRDASVAAFAVILWGAGFSYAAGLSPFVVCALEGAVVMSFSPAAVRPVVAELLGRWELPLYAAFLIVAGALLRPLTAWVVLAALA